ncbi:hypothetical protein [Methanoregula sp. UBA64]|jgi:hypothetical protein|uniref:hypothetical protein n=1 Tax=Methanoregula sp. UBA64 TaxID=1915554 RepID=UPI0025E379F1|nr:hypothetical protein [Methanoregula sp. UBA64]
MKISQRIAIFFAGLVIISAVLMGCTGSTTENTAATTSAVTTTAATATPEYSAGDVVGSSASVSSAWLITGYDTSSDSYTRAFIYKNSDSTWGYRINADTETTKRSVMEKVYTVKLARVTVASVPTAAPTTTSAATTIRTSVTTATVTTTATTTTAPKPSFKDMDPDEGYINETVTSTITGYNFVATPTVKLTKSGSTTITASSVTFDSDSQIEATFDIPGTAAVGPWTIVITNPDGQSLTYQNEFTVREETDDE